GLVALVGWLIVGSLRIWPHQEAFFNELAGDWTQWSTILVDSNLDWGQDLPALRQVMAEQGIGEVNLAYFGKAVPEHYGVRYRPLPGYLRFVEGRELDAYNPYTPEPGWYAISATSLRLGLLQPENVDLYAYFRTQQPVARAGYSIYLYQVIDPPGLPVDRTVVVGEPVVGMGADKLGVQPGRRVQVKWLTSAETAIYPLGVGFTPPADGTYRAVNVNFGDSFTLLGYTGVPATIQPGQTVPLTLYWQVGVRPVIMPAPTRGSPLSAFVHLVDGDPTAIVAQYDGWETALRGLEAGDVIVQRAPLTLGESVQPGVYSLLVGLYSPQSGERLPASGPEAQPDHAVVGQLEVRP
ncbi:MAG: hypothetical protein M3Q45_12875, partial [Chloroflexota bacterium]|nr:hypothetical protein [Chloroflexota bacterium]